MYQTLEMYGLGEQFKSEAIQYPNLYISRVSEQHRDLYKVIGENGVMSAVVSGKLYYSATGQSTFPVVGDFVMVDRQSADSENAVIHDILSRKSIFVRQAAGTSNEQQVVASNIDTLFLCMSLNADFNLRRMERYLTIAWSSQATPVIVLTKSDLCHDLDARLSELSAIAMGANVIVCSSVNSDGLDSINKYNLPGQTIAFVGSSGVGKSTLINRLMGKEVLMTQAIRSDDDKGRHTTTHRQLVLVPGGAIVIDTPGMRELSLYIGDASKSFEDIEELARQCKYNNCSHLSEPNCAVKQAIISGALSEKRFNNYQKIEREISYSGLNARQLENEKINRMFGGKSEMKQAFRDIKKRKHKH